MPKAIMCYANAFCPTRETQSRTGTNTHFANLIKRRSRARRNKGSRSGVASNNRGAVRYLPTRAKPIHIRRDLVFLYIAQPTFIAPFHPVYIFVVVWVGLH